MTPTFTPQAFSTAQAFLDACAPALLATRPAPANLAVASSYPIAAEEATSGPSPIKQWWLSVTSNADDASSSVLFAFVVLKTYPGVLACSADPKSLSEDTLRAAMQAMVEAAKSAELPHTRLTSVIGPKVLSAPFASAWAASHNLTVKEKPLMHMYQSTVTKSLLRPPVRPKLDNVTVGRITMDDLDIATDMLVTFTQATAHAWGRDFARTMAEQNIKDGTLFGAHVDGKLKAIAAFMRPTPGVKAISQVYTAEDARGQGLAELVVREGCERYVITLCLSAYSLMKSSGSSRNQVCGRSACSSRGITRPLLVCTGELVSWGWKRAFRMRRWRNGRSWALTASNY
jgi:predicted GNAT family acetyltransferase